MIEGRVVRAALHQERSSIRRALAAGLLVTLSTIGLAGTSAWLIVRAAQEPVVLSLTVPMGLVQLFALSKAAGRYLERTQTHRAALGVMGHVRASVARVLEPLVPSGLGPNSAEVVDVVLRDVERVQDLLTAVAGPLITSAAAGIVTVVITGAVVPLTALTLVIGLALTALVLPLLATRLGSRSEIEMDTVRRELTSLFDRAAQGGDEYVMSGASSSLEAELSTLEDRFDQAQRRRTAMMGVITSLATLVSGLSVIASVLFSAYALREGRLDPALVAIPALLSVAALELVGGVAPSLVGLRGDRAALARLEQIGRLRAPVQEPLVRGVVDPEASAVHANDIDKHFESKVVLRKASLSLEAGEVVVLSGASGGGKTTLARMIAKFSEPDAGWLELGSSRYDAITSEQVRDVVGFVDDDPHVFATTLAGNLRIARPTASDSELLSVLDRAGLTSLLASLPEGLGTQLGGSSVGLSGGEQRRLGVARELLVDRPVVVLDEPTEGLDEDSAARLMVALVEQYSSSALLVISHRSRDHVAATRRIELRDGSIVELASPEG